MVKPFLIVGLFAWSPLVAGKEAKKKPPKPPKVAAGLSGKQLFEAHCQVCHSLDLPKGQKLSRDSWQWVMDDMVEKYGMTWVSKEDQKKIVDYLAEVYKPTKKKRKVW